MCECGLCVWDQGFTFSMYCPAQYHVHVSCTHMQHDMMQHVCVSSLMMCVSFCMQDLRSAVLDELGISSFPKHLLLSHPPSLAMAPTVADIISPSRGIYRTCIVAHVHVSMYIHIYNM